MAENDGKATGEPAPHTDDAQAREAAQNPLKTAVTPQPGDPRSGSLGWGIPVAAVAVMVVILLVYVL